MAASCFHASGLSQAMPITLDPSFIVPVLLCGVFGLGGPLALFDVGAEQIAKGRQVRLNGGDELVEHLRRAGAAVELAGGEQLRPGRPKPAATGGFRGAFRGLPGGFPGAIWVVFWCAFMVLDTRFHSPEIAGRSHGFRRPTRGSAKPNYSMITMQLGGIILRLGGIFPAAFPAAQRAIPGRTAPKRRVQYRSAELELF